LVGIVVSRAAVRYEKVGEIRATPGSFRGVDILAGEDSGRQDVYPTTIVRTLVVFIPGSPNTVQDLEI
jgi:hypothetical protein